MDVLSNGRTIMGVCAGWSQTEFEGYSEWNGSKVRVDKTKEGLRLILRLWQEDKVDFNGKFYTAKGAVLDPKPVQKPHPPLIFGSAGRRMMRLAGRHADICFLPRWFQMPFEESKKIIEEEARRAGRPERVAYARGSPVYREKEFDMKAIEKDIENAAELGCRYYITPFPETDHVRSMERFAKEVMPSYADLST